MPGRYQRATTFLDEWTIAWADPIKRATEPPPQLDAIATDKAREHTRVLCARTVGVAVHTYERFEEGDVSNPHSVMAFWLARPKLALLDRTADARYEQEDGAEEAARAIADAKRAARGDQ
jgi:hypothetical protein